MSGGGDVPAIEGVSLMWGESVRWDDRRQRLYLVDCAAGALHWLDGGLPPLQTMPLPGTPTGVVLTEGSQLVVCLDDGLNFVDPDQGRVELMAPYPAAMHGRANDAAADGFGNLVTGTLNLAPGPGGLWHFSKAGGWTELDSPFGNVNGPVVVGHQDNPTLVVADTLAERVFAYDYDPARPAAANRRALSDHAQLGGLPDGATADRDGGVWSCVLRRGALVRLVPDEEPSLVELPVANPSAAAFGGAALDRVFVTSIAVDLGGGTGERDGEVLVVDVGAIGRPERRFRSTTEEIQSAG